VSIRYVVGDATEPIERPVIIAHVCNDVRAWGAGFVLAVSRRWSQPERAYRGLVEPNLGAVQFVDCEPGIVVANMIAQRGLSGPRPWLRYEALGRCLALVAVEARFTGASIHMPRIGCGIAGGAWSEVEPIILRECADLSVAVYDLEARGS
jgi:O-acetyl-ADP-ribose deacetylase (regulator of RNase III)